MGAGGGFGGGSGGGRQGGQGGGMMGARLIEQLDLDAGQQKAWEAIRADLRDKMQGARAAAGGDRAKMREAMQAAMGQALARLEPSLKPEQKTKLAALRATMVQGRDRRSGMRGGVVYVLKDGKPSPVAVRVGASDGSSTEIVGPLKPGDQVITGGGPKPKAAKGSPFGGGAGGAGGLGGGPNRIRM